MKLTNLIRNLTQHRSKTSKSFTFHAFGIFSHISSRLSSIENESSIAIQVERHDLHATTYTKNGPKPNTLSQHHRPAAHTTTAQPYPYISIQILIGKSIERVRYKKEEKLLKRGFWILGVRFQFWDDCYKIR